MILFLSGIDIINRTADTYLRESVKFNIEGLSSLKTIYLRTKKTREIDFSIKNLPSLSELYLCTDTIDDNILTRLLEHLQHIEELNLEGNLCYFNLDYLSNLKRLSLSGTLDKSFNFNFFKNLCNQLENMLIALTNIDEKTFVKLFDGCNFRYLEKFFLKHLYSKRFKKEFINRFTALRHLKLSQCQIDKIGDDSFSDSKELCVLDLSGNQIVSIEQNAFSMLKNLRTVDLSYNFKKFHPKFIGLQESVEFIIKDNF